MEIMRRDICKGLGKAQDWALRALQGDGEEQAALLESFCFLLAKQQDGRWREAEGAAGPAMGMGPSQDTTWLPVL